MRSAAGRPRADRGSPLINRPKDVRAHKCVPCIRAGTRFTLVCSIHFANTHQRPKETPKGRTFFVSAIPLYLRYKEIGHTRCPISCVAQCVFVLNTNDRISPPRSRKRSRSPIPTADWGCNSECGCCGIRGRCLRTAECWEAARSNGRRTQPTSWTSPLCR